MCGIFGILTKKEASYQDYHIASLLKNLALLSEARGKDSSGLVIRDENEFMFTIIKGPVAISDLLANHTVKRLEFLNNQNYKNGFAGFGHARLVTNGTQLDDINNQPVVKNGIIGIHNGIIVNADKLWRENSDLSRKYEIDTEVLLALLRKYLDTNDYIQNAVAKAINQVFGTVATAFFFNDRDQFVAATNNGSLYILSNHKDILIFASERHILTSLAKKNRLRNLIGEFKINQVSPNTGYILEFNTFDLERFSLNNPSCHGKSNSKPQRNYGIEVKNIGGSDGWSALVDLNKIRKNPYALSEEKILEYNTEEISHLKRCVKCLLPETFPLIEFDDKGICNICKNYQLRNLPKPISVLQELVEPYRSKKGEQDCIVPFSGGRDSSYVLHTVKKVLRLNPLAFTYDWGMVTDLARRNIARVCGKLGVENIIVAANIKRKRENIRKNVAAWLKRPHLGMIPLFMAGDKYFFSYTGQLKKQTGIKLNIWGVNNLENTIFKVGFCGIRPEFDKKHIYSLNKKNQIKLIGFYGKNFLLNPAYFNSSILDTIGSFGSRFFYEQEHYFHMFDYMRWDEKKIENTIMNEYDWETATDTKSTWRIGDGTASFYNYIYYNVAGFSEIDTFRSNQIREGLISRQEAMELAREENRPRYESIRWYLDIIGLHYESTIKRINSISKLYRK